MTSPLMLQVMLGVGIPSAWQSSRTVSPGENIRLAGAFTQYGAAADTEHTHRQNCGPTSVRFLRSDARPPPAH